jgi:hypothetical protein
LTQALPITTPNPPGIPAARQALLFAGRELGDDAARLGEAIVLDDYNTRQEVPAWGVPALRGRWGKALACEASAHAAKGAACRPAGPTLKPASQLRPAAPRAPPRPAQVTVRVEHRLADPRRVWLVGNGTTGGAAAGGGLRPGWRPQHVAGVEAGAPLSSVMGLLVGRGLAAPGWAPEPCVVVRRGDGEGGGSGMGLMLPSSATVAELEARVAAAEVRLWRARPGAVACSWLRVPPAAVLANPGSAAPRPPSPPAQGAPLGALTFLQAPDGCLHAVVGPPATAGGPSDPAAGSSSAMCERARADGSAAGEGDGGGCFPVYTYCRPVMNAAPARRRPAGPGTEPLAALAARLAVNT